MTGFVFLDKGEGMTSFFAASRLRKIFGTKKIGHTGTLDPLATGVLPVAIGGATRFIELIPDHDKGYVAVFRLGITTDTLDITGEVLSRNEVSVSRADVENALGNFRGEISQLPPMYSAIKKDGVRLYELARQGIEVEREERKITVYSLELTNADEENNEYEITVMCSKGTYIRSLISDIGEKLGCGAAMTKLRRVKANGVDAELCYTLDELSEMKEKGNLGEALTGVDTFISYDKIRVSEAQAKRFSNGGALDCNRFGGKKEPGLYNVYSPEGRFLGIGEIKEGSSELSVKRVFVDA
ncbi:MAG: tRNA pseudouridine(55) synthase TruB [Acutalibacteraceae bacterium]|nr:tRNA pseudouridine(55) synthase TruB [Acutalibacteraceae bacterium]